MSDDSAAPPSAQITGLLQQWSGGSRDALDRLMPLVYDELRLIAARRMSREWRAGGLQTTALVNEAFLKLIDQRQVDWRNRAHFFGVAAQLMRRILIDEARRMRRDKRGGGAVEVPIDLLPVSAANPALDVVDVMELDRVLTQLEALDPDQSRIVELRFFGGLSVEETAEVLHISPATVKREWAVAKGWLLQALRRSSRAP